MESHFFFIQLKNTLENSGNSVNFVYSPLLFFTHFGSRVFHLPLRTIDKMLHILSRKDKVKNRSRKVTTENEPFELFFPPILPSVSFPENWSLLVSPVIYNCGLHYTLDNTPIYMSSRLAKLAPLCVWTCRL